jgi:agmatinase
LGYSTSSYPENEKLFEGFPKKYRKGFINVPLIVTMSTVPFSFLALRDSYEESKYVVVAVPYDSTESWARGTRFGPMAIIEASRYMDPYDIELKRFVNERGIHTIFELPVLGKPVSSMIEIVETTVRRLRGDGKIPVLLGGEHTISFPALRALSHEVDSIVILDAHPDFYDEYEGNRVSHATVCKRMSELVGDIILIGVRTMDLDEVKNINETNSISILFSEEIEKGLEILNRIEGKRVYLSVDIDVLDPPQVPCIGNPEPGGLSYKQVLEVMRRVMELSDVRCMDFVEFAPCPGMRSDSFLVARLVQKAIGYHSLYSWYDEL